MGTLTYAREKDPDTNSTGIATTGEAREDPNALVAIATGAGSFYEVAISGDADESGGVDIQQLYRVKLTPTLGAAAPGVMGLTVEITPVLGGGADGDAVVHQVVHEETMDAWQTAAGRVPQP